MPVNQLLPESSLGTTHLTEGKSNMNKINKYQQWNEPYKESLLKVFEIRNCRNMSNPNMIINEAIVFIKLFL